MRVLENNERFYVMSTQKKVPFAWYVPYFFFFFNFYFLSL
ncbi:unnamed protein product [Onchocerca flexuosa]|uniref:Uncharacterized protein n=1 Tax=Onchocerca flexuosa TaxID=387005 RepID=A0A183HC11_9BILA|nr:unnamed protein product [Onchocerca flexuosa]